MADNYEMKDMTGTLFVNKDKKSDKHPDRSGRIKVNGVEYRLSGWIKKSERTGDSRLSLAVSEIKDNPNTGNNAPTSGGLGHKDYGDDF